MKKLLSSLILLAVSLVVLAEPGATSRGARRADDVRTQVGDAMLLGGQALVQDGGFEAGLVPTFWTQSSTNFGTPICDSSCGGFGPRTGTFWAWFGGAGTAAEAGALQQIGEIAAGTTRLNFHVWWSSSITTPPDPSAFFAVRIDGNTVFSLTPATAAAYSAAYTPVSVDISAYADGNNHTLRFEANNAASSGSTNIHLDDISIVSDGVFSDGFE